MKLSQSELSKLYSAGETIILSFRRAYEIVYSKGASCYITRQVYRHYGDLPLTKRGRYHTVTPEHAHRIIYS